MSQCLEKREGEWARTQKLGRLLGDGLATAEEAKGPVNLGMRCSCPICSKDGWERGNYVTHAYYTNDVIKLHHNQEL